jgi:hypothetical protein
MVAPPVPVFVTVIVPLTINRPLVVVPLVAVIVQLTVDPFTVPVLVSDHSVSLVWVIRTLEPFSVIPAVPPTSCSTDGSGPAPIAQAEDRDEAFADLVAAGRVAVHRFVDRAIHALVERDHVFADLLRGLELVEQAEQHDAELGVLACQRLEADAVTEPLQRVALGEPCELDLGELGVAIDPVGEPIEELGQVIEQHRLRHLAQRRQVGAYFLFPPFRDALHLAAEEVGDGAHVRNLADVLLHGTSGASLK